MSGGNKLNDFTQKQMIKFHAEFPYFVQNWAMTNVNNAKRANVNYGVLDNSITYQAHWA